MLRNSPQNTYIYIYIHVTLDHKTSHNGQFLETEIYTSSEIFPLIHGLLGSDNIWPRCNYLWVKIENSQY